MKLESVRFPTVLRPVDVLALFHCSEVGSMKNKCYFLGMLYNRFKDAERNTLCVTSHYWAVAEYSFIMFCSFNSLESVISHYQAAFLPLVGHGFLKYSQVVCYF